jgi:hypothetical protein
MAEGDGKSYGRGSVAGAQERLAESFVKGKTTQRRLAWPLRKDDTSKWGSGETEKERERQRDPRATAIARPTKSRWQNTL